MNHLNGALDKNIGTLFKFTRILFFNDDLSLLSGKRIIISTVMYVDHSCHHRLKTFAS